MILPVNYKEKYRCINECGATSIIYTNADSTKAYKIYRNKFRYNKEKMDEFLSFHNPNCISPTDTISIENQPQIIVGYEMDFDSGKAISKITNQDLDQLIKASLDFPETLKEISDHHFLIVDPNIENITFSDTYKFVDTYSFLLAKKFATEIIYQKNLRKVNETILCGLIDFAYKKILADFLKNINSRYLSMYENLLGEGYNSTNYVCDMLSIIQESTQENDLLLARKRLLTSVQQKNL